MAGIDGTRFFGFNDSANVTGATTPMGVFNGDTVPLPALVDNLQPTAQQGIADSIDRIKKAYGESNWSKQLEDQLLAENTPASLENLSRADVGTIGSYIDGLKKKLSESVANGMKVVKDRLQTAADNTSNTTGETNSTDSTAVSSEAQAVISDLEQKLSKNSVPLTSADRKQLESMSLADLQELAKLSDEQLGRLFVGMHKMYEQAQSNTSSATNGSTDFATVFVTALNAIVSAFGGTPMTAEQQKQLITTLAPLNDLFAKNTQSSDPNYASDLAKQVNPLALTKFSGNSSAEQIVNKYFALYLSATTGMTKENLDTTMGKYSQLWINQVFDKQSTTPGNTTQN